MDPNVEWTLWSLLPKGQWQFKFWVRMLLCLIHFGNFWVALHVVVKRRENNVKWMMIKINLEWGLENVRTQNSLPTISSRIISFRPLLFRLHIFQFIFWLSDVFFVMINIKYITMNNCCCLRFQPGAVFISSQQNHPNNHMDWSYFSHCPHISFNIRVSSQCYPPFPSPCVYLFLSNIYCFYSLALWGLKGWSQSWKQSLQLVSFYLWSSSCFV